jgi:primosomal protein N' (replication factor Y)
MELVESSDVPASRLREIEAVLDPEPVFPPRLFEWLRWVARYYHHPIGEVLSTALPTVLRRGHPLQPDRPKVYRLTADGRSADPELKAAPLQRRILQRLEAASCRSPAELSLLGNSWRRAVSSLMEKGWVETSESPPPTIEISEQPVTLSEEQSRASTAIIDGLGGFRSFVLFGITGSGKTEVYFEVIREVIARGQQVLVLVPEIALTPQLVKRFEGHTGHRLAVIHSELASGERHRSWALAREGRASIVLGTRSAVFTPLLRPGLIVIDEEHDLSFKQQDGLKYHARDIAVYRAKLEGVPIVLGSATPSFESISNAERKRYDMLRLKGRALGARLPDIELIDMRRIPVEHGLSRTLVEAIRQRLEAGEQSLVFMNRRGFAPVLYCAGCGWQARCLHCDTRMVYHKSASSLRCHHCGYRQAAPAACPDCEGEQIYPLGEGTQRLETQLERLFPDANVVRIDRDSTRGKGELASKLSQGASGAADILVGTQLLSKGHHFPKVTLVGIVDADQGLYSVDFRATEYLFQQIVQVSGRAGRADSPGQVLIQTVHPEHPQFDLLRGQDYAAFAAVALKERELAQAPPYSYFVLLRAESTQPGAGLSFLEQVRSMATALENRLRTGTDIMEPVPSPMEKRAGRYRAQLLLGGRERAAVHQFLTGLIPELDAHRMARNVRWSIDVDPMEMY